MGGSMRLIILAAGQGTRLRPLTNDMPKCLVPVHGRPLLEWQLEAAFENGIDDVVIVTGYHAEKLDGFAVTLRHNPRYSVTNMVYSLHCVEDLLEGDVILSYGDIIYDPSVLAGLMNSQGDLVVTVDMQWESYWKDRFSNPLEDAESLKLNDKNCIVDIGSKCQSVSEIEAQYIGLMKFSGHGCKILKKTMTGILKNDSQKLDSMYMTDLLKDLIFLKHAVLAHRIERGWFEVDDLSDLGIANQQMNSKIDNIDAFNFVE